MSLRTRWMLYTGLPIVLAFALIIGVVTVFLGYQARFEARGWMMSAMDRTVPTLDREGAEFVSDFGVLLRRCAKGGDTTLDVAVLDAISHDHADLVYALRGEDGDFLAGSRCAAVPIASQASFVDCGGRLVAMESVPIGLRTLQVGRYVDGEYLRDIAVATLTEAVLLDGDGVVDATTISASGLPYRPQITEVSGDLRPASGRSFGEATLQGPPYRGYMTQQMDAGKRRVRVYFISAPLDARHWLLLAAPVDARSAGATIATGFISAIMLLGGTLVLLAVILFTRRLADRLAELAIAARRIRGGNLEVSVPVDGSDELAVVCSAFNEMTASLREGRRDLAEASRLGGMAEVATGVLHNVGNIVNSANVNVEAARARVQGLRTDRLARVADLLDEQSDLPAFLSEDRRGRMVPAYVVRVARSLDTDRARLLESLDALQADVEQIKSVVAVQQTYARAVAIRNVDSIDRVVADAEATVRSGFEGHGVRLVHNLEPIDAFPMDATRITQIVANVLRNAKEAVVATGRPDGEVHLRTRVVDGMARIEIEDNGVGIPAEEMEQIFRFGHTTKPNGHGFGLHMAAISAEGMGGSLTCTSDGPGRGARFTLEVAMTEDGLR